MKRFNKKIWLPVISLSLVSIAVGSVLCFPVVSKENPDPIDFSTEEQLEGRPVEEFDITPYLLKESYSSLAELNKDYEAKNNAFAAEIEKYDQARTGELYELYKEKVDDVYTALKKTFPQPKKAAKKINYKAESLNDLQESLGDYAMMMRSYQGDLADHKKAGNQEGIDRNQKLVDCTQQRIDRTKDIINRLTNDTITWKQAEQEWNAMVDEVRKIINPDCKEREYYHFIQEEE